MGDEPPRLTISSSSSHEDIERERHIWRIEAYARRLAGNIIRVIRGAGEPQHLFENIMHLADEIRASPEGTLIGDINMAIARALSDGIDEEEERFDGASLRSSGQHSGRSRPESYNSRFK